MYRYHRSNGCFQNGRIVPRRQSVTTTTVRHFSSNTNNNDNDNDLPDTDIDPNFVFCRDIFRGRIPSQLADLPPDIHDKLMEVQHKSGFLPTIFLVMCRRPPEFRAFFTYYDLLMDAENSASELTIFEKELIVVTTSALNNCLYCVVAHGAMLRVYAKKYESMDDSYNLISDQIAIDYQKSSIITDKQKCMIEYALKLTTDPKSITDTDINALLEQGFSAEAIWDIGSVTAFFALSNRMAHMSGLLPNPEFYDIARKPKTKK